MRPTRMFGEWKQWAGIGVFSYAFFLVALGLAKIYAVHGSGWDVSWFDVPLGAARLASFVTLLTVVALGTKR
jgi:hypothetical protein